MPLVEKPNPDRVPNVPPFREINYQADLSTAQKKERINAGGKRHLDLTDNEQAALKRYQREQAAQQAKEKESRIQH